MEFAITKDFPMSTFHIADKKSDVLVETEFIRAVVFP